jgi:GDP-4-dehydro-6-deoxy-D-mannose reductase
MRTLITGADGFVGRHLSQLLLEKGHAVTGTFFKDLPKTAPSELSWQRCDIRDANEVADIIRTVEPEQIFHLAAYSSPAQSFHHAREVHETNFGGTFNLLEAVRVHSPKSRVLVVGSSQCYGRVKESELPVTEDHPFNPESPYAVSKAAADLLAYQYFCSNSLHIIRARPSNHTGPGQSADYVCSDFAKQAAEIELGLRKPEISVGNLDVERDFSDVRDVAKAYDLMLEIGKSGEAYNVGSGTFVSLRAVIDAVTSLSSRKITITVRESRKRSGEASRFFVSNQKIVELGWNLHHPLRETLAALFRYWLDHSMGFRQTASPTHKPLPC